jgi:hypothetical protein
MEMTQTIELPTDVYDALIRAAIDGGTTPAGWIALHLRSNGTTIKARNGSHVVKSGRKNDAKSGTRDLQAYADGLSKAQWKKLNSRRSDLIDLECHRALTPQENAELDELQEIAGHYIDRIAPLPWEALVEFEEAARQITARSSGRKSAS